MWLDRLKALFRKNEELQGDRSGKQPLSLELRFSPKRWDEIAHWKDLHRAAITGNAEDVQTLIRCGFDVNEQDKYGCTPLHYAAQSGSVEAMRDLLRSGALENMVNRNGETPLDCARNADYESRYNEALFQANQMMRGEGYYGWLAEKSPLVPLNKTVDDLPKKV